MSIRHFIKLQQISEFWLFVFQKYVGKIHVFCPCFDNCRTSVSGDIYWRHLAIALILN